MPDFKCESAEFNGPVCQVQCSRCKPASDKGTPMNERVRFRLLACPECMHQMCWVNPRLPNHCPECGKHIQAAIRSNVLLDDDDAWLRYHSNVQPGMPGYLDRVLSTMKLKGS